MNHLLRNFLGLVSLGAVAACAAPTTSDDTAADENAGSSEAALEKVDFPAGTELVTTANLNLRQGAGTTFPVLVVIPANTVVSVGATSGASGWLSVTYAGKTGFASGKYLAIPPTHGDYSPTRGGKMAARALALWSGHSSRNLCLAGVDDTAESSGALPPGVSWIPRQSSAVAWQSYVNAHPDELLKRGYERQDRDVNHLPKGSIIGWRAGQCGYHSVYGHIEVVVDDNSSRACSDYCGSVKKNCGNPYVYVPIEL